MRYHLRTLMVILVVGPPVIWGVMRFAGFGDRLISVHTFWLLCGLYWWATLELLDILGKQMHRQAKAPAQAIDS